MGERARCSASCFVCALCAGEHVQCRAAHLRAGPGQAHAVLRHLQTGDRHAACAAQQVERVGEAGCWVAGAANAQVPPAMLLLLLLIPPTHCAAARCHRGHSAGRHVAQQTPLQHLR